MKKVRNSVRTNTRFTARRPDLHSIAPKPARIALPWAGGGRSNTLCYITNTPHVE
jgi:hypothetical protein